MNRSQEEFDSISKAIKKELELFEVQRVKDFKLAFISYLEAQVKAQDKVSLFTGIFRFRAWNEMLGLLINSVFCLLADH